MRRPSLYPPSLATRIGLPDQNGAAAGNRPLMYPSRKFVIKQKIISARNGERTRYVRACLTPGWPGPAIPSRAVSYYSAASLGAASSRAFKTLGGDIG